MVVMNDSLKCFPQNPMNLKIRPNAVLKLCANIENASVYQLVCEIGICACQVSLKNSYKIWSMFSRLFYLTVNNMLEFLKPKQNNYVYDKHLILFSR